MKTDNKTSTQTTLDELCGIYNLSSARLAEMLSAKKLTVPEVAEILGIHRSKVYDLIASGDLLGFRIHRNYRIPAPAVVDYLARKMLQAALD